MDFDIFKCTNCGHLIFRLPEDEATLYRVMSSACPLCRTYREEGLWTKLGVVSPPDAE